MSTNLTVNGVTYAYPETGNLEWGDEAQGWASAMTSGALLKSGGEFTLTAAVDFGPSYGIKSLYYSSDTANPGSAGEIRFAKTDTLTFRNNANTGDLELGINASDLLQFNTVELVNLSATQSLSNKTLTSPVLNTAVSGTAVLDEDAMTSNSATQIATQQSIKAYVDNSLAGDIVCTDLAISDVVGNEKTLSFQVAAANRWQINARDAESGSDAGTTFRIEAFTDAAVKIDAPIAILRAAGANIEVSRPILSSELITTTSYLLGNTGVKTPKIGPAADDDLLGLASGAATVNGTLKVTDLSNGNRVLTSSAANLLAESVITDTELTYLDNIIPETQDEIDNNATDENVVGLAFAVGTFRSMTFTYSLFRSTSVGNLVQAGTVSVIYDGSGCHIGGYKAGDAGVTFDCDAAGQVTYSSSNMAGTGYTADIRFDAKRFLLEV